MSKSIIVCDSDNVTWISPFPNQHICSIIQPGETVMLPLAALRPHLLLSVRCSHPRIVPLLFLKFKSSIGNQKSSIPSSFLFVPWNEALYLPPNTVSICKNGCETARSWGRNIRSSFVFFRGTNAFILAGKNNGAYKICPRLPAFCRGIFGGGGRVKSKVFPFAFLRVLLPPLCHEVVKHWGCV